MRRLLLSLVDRIIRGIIGCALGAFYGWLVHGFCDFDFDVDPAPREFWWIGPVLGMVVGLVLGVTIGHFEFEGRTSRITIGIFAGFIIGMFVGAAISGKLPAVDQKQRDMHDVQGLRLGSIVGPLLGGVIGARWKSRRDSALS